MFLEAGARDTFSMFDENGVVVLSTGPNIPVGTLYTKDSSDQIVMTLHHRYIQEHWIYPMMG